MKLYPQLLLSVDGSFDPTRHATIEAHGLYNTFQFVLRLSPAVHRKLAELPAGILTNQEAGFDRCQAFSTLLHETIHWWQHIGSTYGLMLSLSYPTQLHANYVHLKELLAKLGFKKSIRQLAKTLPGPSAPDTLAGLANRIVNNHFDFGAYRALTFSAQTARTAVENPMFENVAHAYQVTYANNLLVLASTTDPEFRALQDPRGWEGSFQALRSAKEKGFYYGSPVDLWPIGAHEILEGQACFSQLQYLAFACNGRLGFDDFRTLGMLHGVYQKAFQEFLLRTGLEWPASLIHPTVGLFLLICDLAINPGSGFPHSIFPHFPSFITDTDPGARFTMLATTVRLKCPHLAEAIREYTREEYVAVSNELCAHLLIDPPISIAATFSEWTAEKAPLAGLMDEYRTFEFRPLNQPVRVLFAHFLAFMQDKFLTPEFFCWPGAWMAGDRVSEQASALFDRHAALFIDKEHDDGVFVRLIPGQDEQKLRRMFETFYGANLAYDMTDQWIRKSGPFTYNYKWLSSTGSEDEIKAYADSQFEIAYGFQPDSAELLSSD